MDKTEAGTRGTAGIQQSHGHIARHMRKDGVCGIFRCGHGRHRNDRRQAHDGAGKMPPGEGGAMEHQTALQHIPHARKEKRRNKEWQAVCGRKGNALCLPCTELLLDIEPRRPQGSGQPLFRLCPGEPHHRAHRDDSIFHRRKDDRGRQSARRPLHENSAAKAYDDLR